MPSRGATYEIIGTGRGSENPYEHRDSYEWGGYAGGAEDRRKGLGYQSGLAQQRTGPEIDRTQQDADFTNALQSRGNEQYLQGYLGGVMTGQTETPAQAQLRQQTAQAQAFQRSAGASGHGFAAVAGGQRDAQMRGQQMGLVGGQQLQVQRANDMAMARDQYGDLANAMREQDLRARGLQQQGAWDQAKLTDEQRAANDAMARFYMNERYKVGGDQLSANQGYEKQITANKFQQTDLAYTQQQQQYAREQQYQVATAKMGSDALAVGSSMSSDDDEERR